MSEPIGPLMTAYARGHAVGLFGPPDDQGIFSDWRYLDDMTATKVEERPCAKCGVNALRDEPDPCLGWLPGVAFACCGHGVPGQEYVKVANGHRYDSVAEWRDCPLRALDDIPDAEP